MIPTVHTSTLYTTLYLVYVCVPVVLLIPDLLRMRQSIFFVIVFIVLILMI